MKRIFTILAFIILPLGVNAENYFSVDENIICDNTTKQCLNEMTIYYEKNVDIVIKQEDKIKLTLNGKPASMNSEVFTSDYVSADLSQIGSNVIELTLNDKELKIAKHEKTKIGMLTYNFTSDVLRCEMEIMVDAKVYADIKVEENNPSTGLFIPLIILTGLLVGGIVYYKKIKNKKILHLFIIAMILISYKDVYATGLEEVVISESIRTTCPVYNNMYATVEQMQKDTSIELGQIIKTEGFYEAGDAGGSFYNITDVATANEMNVIELDNGLYASLVESEYSDEINVMQYGLKVNDKNHDAGIPIQKAVESGAEKITMPKDAEVYLNSQVIFENNPHATLTFDGNNSMVYFQDEYIYIHPHRWMSEWIFLLNTDNIVFENLNMKSLKVTPYTDANKNIGITAVGIYSANNITIRNVDIEGPDAKYYEDGSSYNLHFSGIDIFSGWDNVLVDNVKIVNENDAPLGGTIGIRDIWGEGTGKVTIQNSHFQKIYHDEIISMGMPNADEFNDITIVNNTFISRSGKNSFSPHLISLGDGATPSPLHNLYFANNTLEFDSTMTGLNIRTHGDNNIIENNDINISIAEGYDYLSYDKVGFAIYFNPINAGASNPTPIIFRDNKITLNNDLDNNIDTAETPSFSEVLWGRMNAYDNQINVTGDLVNIVANGAEIKNNEFNINGNVTSIQRNSYIFDNNIVNVNSADSYSRFDSYTMEGNYSFSNNDITVTKEKEGIRSHLNIFSWSTVNANTSYKFNNNKVSLLNPNNSITNFMLSNYSTTVVDDTSFSIEMENNVYPSKFNYIEPTFGTYIK